MIGHGGMGSVYRARDTRLQRQVALKILTPAGETPSALVTPGASARIRGRRPASNRREPLHPLVQLATVRVSPVHAALGAVTE